MSRPLQMPSLLHPVLPLTREEMEKAEVTFNKRMEEIQARHKNWVEVPKLNNNSLPGSTYGKQFNSGQKSPCPSLEELDNDEGAR